MFRVFSAKSMTATVAAALMGSFAAFWTTLAPAAIAQSGAEATAQRVLAKGDRLPRLVTGAACSTQSWPSFDQKCQFDLRRSADEVREVRVVSLIRDRLPTAN
jgi:hypothetical protein